MDREIQKVFDMTSRDPETLERLARSLQRHGYGWGFEHIKGLFDLVLPSREGLSRCWAFPRVKPCPTCASLHLKGSSELSPLGYLILNLLVDKSVWVKKDGTKKLIIEMGDAHLYNTLRMLRRKENKIEKIRLRTYYRGFCDMLFEAVERRPEVKEGALAMMSPDWEDLGPWSEGGPPPWESEK